MANDVLRAYHVEHPAPHGDTVPLWLLWVGLLGAPAAWSLELLVNYAFASHACFPREQPRTAAIPGWEGVTGSTLAINIVALLVAVICTTISVWAWRRSRGESHGTHGRLLEAGEGRTRFLAVWGTWSGVWFALSIGFNTISLLEVPLCGS